MYNFPRYPTVSEISNVTGPFGQIEASAPRKVPRTRPRGHDGRFVPKATVEQYVEEQERKVCGWCRTSDTSQWRVGPTDGSVGKSSPYLSVLLARVSGPDVANNRIVLVVFDSG